MDCSLSGMYLWRSSSCFFFFSLFLFFPFKVSGELSAASPERLSMASPGVGGGKRIHPLPYTPDANQSRTSLFRFEYIDSVDLLNLFVFDFDFHS